MISWGNSDPRARGTIVGAAVILVIALVAFSWLRRLDRVPQPPLERAALSDFLTVRSWTIDGQPISDGLTLTLGTTYELHAAVEPTGTAKVRSAQRPYRDLFLRFAKRQPIRPGEASPLTHGFRYARGKILPTPYRPRIPPGEYELQLVASRHVNPKTATAYELHPRPLVDGEVLATAIVRVEKSASR